MNDKKLTDDQACELHLLLVGDFGLSQEDYKEVYALVSSLMPDTATSARSGLVSSGNGDKK